jgi:flagellar hook-associated protein 2
VEEAVATSTFSVSGLSTGMDTASMIDKLVSLEQQPLTNLQKQQTAYKAQVSQLGALASKLSALQDAANALKSGGTLGVKATGANTSFAAVPGTGAAAGSYAVQVTSLATAAKERSTGFVQGATLQAGSLTLNVDGKDYSTDTGGNPTITWSAGATLGDVAAKIRASGAPVSATVLFDGQKSYLSITKRDTGYVPDGSPLDDGASKALVVSDDLDQLGMAPLKDSNGADLLPKNAAFNIDGLSFTRSSNVVSDALPGTTLTLKSAGGPAEDLTLENDVDATQKRLQTFVDAYNGVMSFVQGQLDVSQGSDRTSSLAGDSTIKTLQRALQSLGTSIVGTGSVRALADLGLKTQRDGSLTIDASVLSSAIARDPSAVDALFADENAGIAKVASALVDGYDAPSSGFLSIRQSGLTQQIRAMDDQAARMQARIDAYRATLVAQFTTMETIVGQYKSIGSFLTQQSNAASNGSN